MVDRLVVAPVAAIFKALNECDSSGFFMELQIRGGGTDTSSVWQFHACTGCFVTETLKIEWFCAPAQLGVGEDCSKNVH